MVEGNSTQTKIDGQLSKIRELLEIIDNTHSETVYHNTVREIITTIKELDMSGILKELDTDLTPSNWTELTKDKTWPLNTL